jgi:bifunctional non-homologous end joining protein LigD
MLVRTSRSGCIEPCLPSPADRPPSGPDWVHEIKHDGYRLMARRDPVGIRLLTRNGHDWALRYPLIVEAVNWLKVRSCLIDGEAVACDENGLAVFELLRDEATRPSCLSVRLRLAGAERQGLQARALRGA